MKIKKNNKGFTMAEMLIVVAIIVILMGVAFLAVHNYQRSATRLEYDGIAKEIFIAAQNHLTMAESQGYLQLSSADAAAKEEDLSRKLGTKADSSADTTGDERYFLYRDVHHYSTDPLQTESVLDLMLPFGAIDETVRAGGTYIIRYQPSSGRVLDVFYSLPGRSSLLTVAGLELRNGDYTGLMGGYRGDESNVRRARERFTGTNGDTGVVGWYGGEESLPVGTRLEDPELVVHNEEVLWIEVTDKNIGNGSLQLTLTGKTSGAQRSFDLRSNDEDRVEGGIGAGKIKVILDDITRFGYHFAELKTDAELKADDTSKHFIPGEDIIIEAVAYNNTALTNIAYSGKKTTNSLFADYEASGEGANTDHTALIENFRHFENLDKKISSFSNGGVWKKQDGSFETVTKAKQIKDMIWTKETTASPTAKPDSFIEAVEYINGTKPSSIFNKDNTAVTKDEEHKVSFFYPVSPDYKLDYEGASYGQNHKITDVKADYSGDAGLFGSVDDSAVRNLELIDFDITSTSGNAGALIGKATGTTITNVLAHNSAANDENFDNNDETEDKKPNVTGTSSAGGLIGSMTGGSVTKSAAAVYVNSSSGSAGGLIGSASTTTVSASYSGGHTYSGNPGYSNLPAGVTAPSPARNPYPVRYYNDKNEPIYNVTGGTTAGGLIGSAGDSTISYSYSTCSATGATAGGFVGTSTGSISKSYCTGLVAGSTTEGAFAGTLTRTPTNCQYFEIINERQNVDEKDNTKILPGYHYLKALGGDTDGGIAKLDATWGTYQEFSRAPTEWKDAHPYDSGLTRNYQNKYNLETVEQLGATLQEGSNDKTVYFVKDHYGDWPAPEEFVFNAG